MTSHSERNFSPTNGEHIQTYLISLWAVGQKAICLLWFSVGPNDSLMCHDSWQRRQILFIVSADLLHEEECGIVLESQSCLFTPHSLGRHVNRRNAAESLHDTTRSLVVLKVIWCVISHLLHQYSAFCCLLPSTVQQTWLSPCDTSFYFSFTTHGGSLGALRSNKWICLDENHFHFFQHWCLKTHEKKKKKKPWKNWFTHQIHTVNLSGVRHRNIQSQLLCRVKTNKLSLITAVLSMY